jgi:hypothetical protein
VRQRQNHTKKHYLPTTIKMPEGHQGPPPEQQSGAQMHDTPASGKGTDDASNKEQTNKTALDVRVSEYNGVVSIY